MKNLLPILIFAMLSQSGSGIAAENLAPVLKMLGLNSDALSALKDPLSSILGGNSSMEKLLPLIVRMMNAPAPKTSKKEGGEFSRPNYLNPISDFASDEVTLALSSYFGRADCGP